MQYLVSVIDDAARLASPAETVAIDVFNDRLQADGYWVFAGGLGSPSAATVIDNRGDEAMFSDGPFVESKEFLIGFWIIEAADLDVALALAAVFLCVGLVDALIDIANNAQGLWVQRRLGTSIITGLHGLWSVGAVVGGLIGSVFAGLGVPVRWHLVITGALFAVSLLLVSRLLLPGHEPVDEPEPVPGPTGAGGGAHGPAAPIGSGARRTERRALGRSAGDPKRDADNGGQ